LCEANGKAEEHQLMLHIKKTVCGGESIEDGTNFYLESDEDQLMLLLKFYFRFKILNFGAEFGYTFYFEMKFQFSN